MNSSKNSRKSKIEVECASCFHKILNEDSNDRSECEICGSLSRNFFMKIDEEVRVDAHLGLKHKSGDPKYNSKQKMRYELINTVEKTKIKGIEAVRKIQIIDKDRNWYFKKVWDINDQENILRKVEHPLTEHKGRGSAKFDKKKK